MSVALLDVNILIALLDPRHSSHDEAHRWFGHNRRRGWATSPITLNGCIRILSNPTYPTDDSLSEVLSSLRTLCSADDHRFWEDSVSLLDPTLFRAGMITGHKKITDIYLLGLAVRHNGKFATFDHSISLKAVVGAEAAHLEILG